MVGEQGELCAIVQLELIEQLRDVGLHGAIKDAIKHRVRNDAKHSRKRRKFDAFEEDERGELCDAAAGAVVPTVETRDDRDTELGGIADEVLAALRPLAARDGEVTSLLDPLNKPTDPNLRDYEAEANVFASELLLQRNLVAPHCQGSPPSLEIPRAIAFEFTMSVPASSIRYVQLTRERCMVIYSEGGKIEWAPRSRGFKTDLPKGMPLPRGSIALDCARNVHVDDRPQSRDARVWFDTSEDVEIIEHSAPVSEAGGVITLLWAPEGAAERLWPRRG